MEMLIYRVSTCMFSHLLVSSGVLVSRSTIPSTQGSIIPKSADTQVSDIKWCIFAYNLHTSSTQHL